jgi:hypothetical protein
MLKSPVQDKVWKKDPPFDEFAAREASSPAASVRGLCQISADIPKPGPQNCASPFIASGPVIGLASDILDIRVDIVVGVGPMARLIQGPLPNVQVNGWTCNFDGNFPLAGDVGLPAMLVIRATTSDGGTIALNVPFSHVPAPMPQASTVLFSDIVTNRNITITGQVGPNITKLTGKVGSGPESPNLVTASDRTFWFSTSETGSGEKSILFTATDNSATPVVTSVEFPVKLKLDMVPPFAVCPTALSVNSATFDVVYTKRMASSALDRNNYHLTPSTGGTVNVTSVVLASGSDPNTTTVTVNVPALAQDSYTFSIDPVTDVAGNTLAGPHSFAINVS